MNILYIDHYAGSPEMGMEFRPYYLSREWVKLGHNVRIVGADFSHLRKKNPVITHNFETQVIDGVEYQWVKTRQYEGNGINRAITMAEFCGRLYVNASRMVREFSPDIIITSSTYPIDTFPGQKLRRVSGKATLIHEIHDMWPLTPIEMYGMSPKHPFVQIMQYGENSFCKHADKVVSVLPGACDYLVEHGMKRENFYYIPNGIDLAEWNNPDPLPELHEKTFQKAHQENKLIVCFFGSHTRSYNIDLLLKAAKQLNSNQYFFALVGSGIYKEELINLAKKLELPESNYAFLPQISKKAIPTLLDQIDISYIGLMKNGLNRFGIGMNKMFDAMMGGKPILYAVEASNNLINEFNCGVSVEPESVSALCQGLNEFLRMATEERVRLGQNGRSAVVEHFSYPVLARQFMNIVA